MPFFNSLKQVLGFSDKSDSPYGSSAAPYVNPFSKGDPTADESSPLSNPRTVDGVAGLDHYFISQMEQLIGEHTMELMDEAKKKWEDEREKLFKQASQADQRVKDIQARLQEMESQRRVAQNRANDLSTKLKNAQNETEQLKIEKDSLASQLKVMQTKQGGKPVAVADDTETKRLNELIVNLRRQLEEQTQKAVSAQRFADESESEQVQQLQELLRQRDSEIEQLKNELAEANHQVEILRQQEDEVPEEVAQQLQQMQEFKTKKNAEISTLRRQVEEMKTRLSDADTLRAQLVVAQNDREKLQKTIENLHSTAKDTAERRNRRDIDVANQLDETRRQLKDALARVDSYKAQCQQLTHENSEIDQHLKQAVAEKVDAKAELNKLRQELEEKSERLREMTADRPVAESLESVAEAGAHTLFAQQPALEQPHLKPHLSPSVSEIDNMEWGDPAPDNDDKTPQQPSLF